MRESETDNCFALEILPVCEKIGGLIGGVRLSGELDAATVTAIRCALLKYKVIFFRGQNHLDDAAHEALGELFGELVPHPIEPCLEGTRAVQNIDGSTGRRATIWHTDVTFVDAYPQASILRALIVPERGGDTIWANTATAYEALPARLRHLADGLWAVHSNYTLGMRKVKPHELRRYLDKYALTAYETKHPVVRVHPETRERTLLLGGFVRKLLGLLRADSTNILSELQAYITQPENTVRWQWKVGDVAIWDNRATQHVAVDDYGDLPRLLRRVTIAGDAPVSIDGRRSEVRSRAEVRVDTPPVSPR